MKKIFLFVSLASAFCFESALAETSITQLSACEKSLRGHTAGLNKLARKDDLLIIRDERIEKNSLLAQLHLFHEGQASLVIMPSYAQFYLAKPKQLVVTLPNEHQLCLYYKISAFTDDKITVAEKMPSKNCSGKTDHVVATEAPADQKLLRNLIEKRIKSQIEFLQMYENDNKTSDERLRELSKNSLNDLRNRVKSWDTSACLALEDAKITTVIKELKTKGEATFHPQGPALAPPASDGAM